MYVKFDKEVVHKCVYKFSVDFFLFNFKWFNGMTIRQCGPFLVEITRRNGLVVRNSSVISIGGIIEGYQCHFHAKSFVLLQEEHDY